MHRLYMLVIVFVLLALQTSFLPLLAWEGISPDLMLAFVILVGFYVAPREGLIWGIVVGIARDLLFGKFVGLFILVYAVSGYAAGYFSRQVYRSGVLMPAFTLFWASLLAHSLVLFFVSLVMGYAAFLDGLLNVVLPLAVFNLFLFPVLNRPAIWWADYLKRVESEQA